MRHPEGCPCRCGRRRREAAGVVEGAPEEGTEVAEVRARQPWPNHRPPLQPYLLVEPLIHDPVTLRHLGQPSACASEIRPLSGRLSQLDRGHSAWKSRPHRRTLYIESHTCTAVPNRPVPLPDRCVGVLRRIGTGTRCI
jgi:hypothetical protein